LMPKHRWKSKKLVLYFKRVSCFLERPFHGFPKCGGTESSSLLISQTGNEWSHSLYKSICW
jgi:hypothetical protein